MQSYRACNVLPGDLVIADREGVLFIPAQLAELAISTAEFVTLKDKFGFEMENPISIAQDK